MKYIFDNLFLVIDSIDQDDWINEKVNEFKYHGVCKNTKND